MNTLFDKHASENRKQHGMEAAAGAQETNLQLARRIAVQLCRAHGEVTADDVGKVLHTQYGIDSLGPAAGSLFKGGQFVFTGRRRRSERKKNHAREIKVWKLKV
jgi:hypothetical protein